MSSLRQLDEASQCVTSVVSCDRRQLTRQTVDRLLSHLHAVNDEAAKRKKAVSKRLEDLTTYQVRLLNSCCHGTLSGPLY